MKQAYLRNAMAFVILLMVGFLFQRGAYWFGIGLLIPAYVLITTDLSK